MVPAIVVNVFAAHSSWSWGLYCLLIVLLSRSEERSDTMSDQLSVFLKVSLPNVIYDTRFEKPIRWDVFA
ncbi:hypothetical protein D8S78_24065 [Natrialba swarupiae]|nr:hypothetical protein [Natrialba swarupiae]